jgi:tetratricopeptide (TPR) repeat protein
MSNRPGAGARPGAGIGNRPGIDARPGAGIGNRPGIDGRPGAGIGNRPGIDGRPGAGIGNRPGIDARPGAGIGNRPGIDGRPGAGIGNRPGIDGRPGTGIDNRPGLNPPGTGAGGAWGNRPGDGYHQGWLNGYWHGYNDASGWNWGSFGWGVAAAGLTSWGLGSTLWNWGYASYENPYYVEQPVVVGEAQPIYQPPYDYSQPLATLEEPPAEAVADPAIAAFEQSRQVFTNGDYAQALRLTDEVLKSLPNDATVHEFRALCLFALQRYDEAATPLYAVLSVGPGWDWTTLAGLYTDIGTYTAQIRTLEAYVREHPDSAPPRFVLAYHYLTQGHAEAAVSQLRRIVALNPGDSLSASLIARFSPASEGDNSATDTARTEQPQQPAQAAPPAGVAPANEKAITGTWKAAPRDGVSIELTLGPDGKFSWSVTQQGKSQTFGGDFTYGGGTLTLITPDGAALVGRLGSTDPNHMQFRVAGGPAGDPGLSFSK